MSTACDDMHDFEYKESRHDLFLVVYHGLFLLKHFCQFFESLFVYHEHSSPSFY